MGIMSDNSKQFEYLAIGGEVPHHGVLPQRAVEQYRSIQQYLTKEWRTSNESRQRWLWSINGCLDKLSTTLMQVARMRDHHDQLISHARELQKAPPEAHIALAAQEACGDFESLLLQGRAALDRLTWFLAEEFNQRCTRFSKLKKVLSNSLIGEWGSRGVADQPSRTTRPEHHRETEKANAPLKLGRYLEKISDPCRSSDPSLDE